MSNFSVIVIGDNPEAQLIAFQKAQGTSYQEGFVFEDLEQGYRNDYATLTETRYRGIEGALYTEFEMMRLAESDQSVYEQYAEVEVSMKELYPTFEAYIGDNRMHYYPLDPTTGRYGRWYNPNGQFDSYTLGGLEEGFFLLQQAKGARLCQGNIKTGPCKSRGRKRPGYADQALKGQIDFERMPDTYADDAAAFFDKVTSWIDPAKPPISLQNCLSQFATRSEARNFYYDQPWIRRLGVEGFMPHGECAVDYFMLDNGGREAFRQRAKDNFSFGAYAVIRDGQWYSSEGINFYARDYDPAKADDWGKHVEDMLLGVPDDTLVAYYGCHA